MHYINNSLSFSGPALNNYDKQPPPASETDIPKVLPPGTVIVGEIVEEHGVQDAVVQVGIQSPNFSAQEYLAATQALLVQKVTQSDDTLAQKADLAKESQTVTITIRRVLMPRSGSERFEQHPDTYFKTIPRLSDSQSGNTIPDINEITHTVRRLIGVKNLSTLQTEATEDDRFVWFRKP